MKLITLLAVILIFFAIYMMYQLSKKTTIENEHSKATATEMPRETEINVTVDQINEMIGAIQNNDLAKFNELFEAGFPADYVIAKEKIGTQEDLSLLTMAIGSSSEIALCLIEHGANIQEKPCGSTMLHLACMTNKWDVAKLLLEQYHFDPHSKADQGTIPAHMAAWGGCLNALKHFVEKCGVDVNAVNDLNESLLHFAANGGNVDCAKYLIEKGANLLTENTQGQTPYEYAKIANQNRDLIVNFFQNQLNGTVVPHEKIVNAFLYGTLEDCQKLVDEGRNISIAIGGLPIQTKHADGFVSTQEENVSLLLMLIEKNELEKIRLLLNHGNGTDVQFAMPNGWNCSFAAIKANNLEILQLLVDKGADLQATAIDGMNLLQYACFKGNIEIVKFLLEKGLDPNMRGTDETPAYFYACNDREILELLVKHGADLELRNKTQGSIMHFVAASGVTESFDFLVSLGADPNAKDNLGHTPYDVARANGDTKMQRSIESVKVFSPFLHGSRTKEKTPEDL